MNNERPAPRNYDTGPEFNQTAMTITPEHELGVAKDVARAMQEVQAAIVIAKRFPRNEDEARVKLLKACQRPSFAEEAEYEFPRGGSQVSGPSVALAREAARVWGNVQFGFEITHEDDEWRTIRCFAWDVETNTRPVQEDRFKKLIYRKGKGWIEPDERDLRELTNRRAAIAYRNCVLQVLPKDLIDEAIDKARLTLQNRAAQDPDGERKRVADAFATINVLPSTLDQILGHPLAQASPAEIASLRGIFKSIRDGNSTISEYLQGANGHQDGSVANKSAERLENIRNRYEGAQGQPEKQPAPAAAQSGAENPQPPAESATGPEVTTPPAQPQFDAKTAVSKIVDNQRSQHSTKRGEQAPDSAPEGLPGVFDDSPGRGRRR